MTLFNKADAKIEELEARIVALETPPPPPPPAFIEHWRSDFLSSSEWDAVLTGGGGSVTVGSGFGIATIPATTAGGVRAELQSDQLAHGGCLVGDERVYEWEFMIPKASVLSTTVSGQMNHIAQFHTDIPAWTGGAGIWPGDKLMLHVKGGTYSGGDGGSFSYSKDHVLGQMVRDRWHKVRVHYLWAVNGFVEAWFDDQPVLPKTNCPTVGATAKSQKFRLGQYRGASTGRSDLYLRNARVLRPA